MKNTMKTFALLLGVIAASTLGATAQERGKGKGPGGPGARGGRPLPAEVVKEHDKDNDGKLNAEERKAAMEALRAKWEAMSEDERKAEMEKRRAEMEKRRKAWQEMSPEDRKAQMEERMKKRFDKDNDGQLNEDEQAAMEKAMEELQKRMKERGDRPGRPEGRRGPGGPGKGKGKGGPGAGKGKKG
jgi:molecular chaperone DnaK (HSP70)